LLVLAIFAGQATFGAADALAVTPCADSRDNDSDGRTDLNDAGCETASDVSEKLECQDEIDNDKDGFMDRGGVPPQGGSPYSADPDCTSLTDNSERWDEAPVVLLECYNSIDDDGDYWLDWPTDPNCNAKTDDSELADPGYEWRTQCSDNKDNNGNGQKDPYNVGADLQHECWDGEDWSEELGKQYPPGSAGHTACSDMIENEYPTDFKADYPADPGCSSYDDNSEADAPECGDQIDNDGDGKSNFPTDKGCTSVTDPTEGTNTPPPAGQQIPGAPACSDNISNDDGDPLVDYPLDPGCYSAADTDEGDVTQCGDGVDNGIDGLADKNGGGYPFMQPDPDCETTWDTTENDTDYTNPPASGFIETINWYDDPVVRDVEGSPSNFQIRPPMPPEPPNMITCQAGGYPAFMGGSRLNAQGQIERYRDPTMVAARVWLQCNKPIMTGTFSEVCLQSRQEGAAFWQNYQCESQGFFGSGWMAIFGQSYHDWNMNRACKSAQTAVGKFVWAWRVSIKVRVEYNLQGIYRTMQSGSPKFSAVGEEYCKP
jgi:hypothetical protein